MPATPPPRRSTSPAAGGPPPWFVGDRYAAAPAKAAMHMSTSTTSFEQPSRRADEKVPLTNVGAEGVEPPTSAL